MIPHEVELYGHRYRVRFGGPGFDPRVDEAQVVHCDDVEPGVDPLTITLAPALKGNEPRAIEALIHEVLHIVDRHEPTARAAMTPGELNRVTRWTWKRWKKLDHKLVHQLDAPLARAIAAIAVFRCVCRRCIRREALRGRP